MCAVSSSIRVVQRGHPRREIRAHETLLQAAGLLIVNIVLRTWTLLTVLYAEGGSLMYAANLRLRIRRARR